jgi:hypothetical protein
MGGSSGVICGAMFRMQDRFAGKPMTHSRRHTEVTLTGPPQAELQAAMTQAGG